MEDRFEMLYNNVTLKVERLNIPGYTSFRVVFSSARLPTVVAKATDYCSLNFWTSIPEERQQKAECVGKLIDEYLTNTT